MVCNSYAIVLLNLSPSVSSQAMTRFSLGLPFEIKAWLWVWPFKA